ncbi:A24 family peptidase [Roseisolibacter sp. H3M3-2]|uniref:A24 family peptidase n=1 Tax=Roseisolibacter sp. H3M3-2 TaxID=3031323 RepID=UPI0023DCA516|nr:A24 family peptidase [Roseisolibacter sp. H3M3-2]MDF1501875.1 A24 family peptidase [Roseisolibacter sp. H3M3-2]
MKVQQMSSFLGPGSAAVLLVALRCSFVALLVTAAWTDVRERRIPNPLTGSLLLLGVFASLLPGATPAWPAALLSVTLGLLVWKTLDTLLGSGLGDVKLFAAASAWFAPLDALNAAAWTGVIGGALGVFWLFYAREGGLRSLRFATAFRDRDQLLRPAAGVAGRDARVPYGVAMVAALLLQAARSWRAS